VKTKLASTVVLGIALLLGACSGGDKAAPKDVIRYKGPGNFPIAKAVEVPAGKSMVFLSGVLAPIADETKPKDSQDAYGDMETQTLGALKTIEASLKDMGMTMGDVVKMTVFMKGDPEKNGLLDFEGMMKAYTQFFGTADQPNLPARSAFQVAALVRPQYLIEIEVIAVRP
jgi:enamine deaminase RidA (YjgF/YER057c/UK114 family)